MRWNYIHDDKNYTIIMRTANPNFSNPASWYNTLWNDYGQRLTTRCYKERTCYTKKRALEVIEIVTRDAKHLEFQIVHKFTRKS